MKKIIFSLVLILSFAGMKSQIPDTDIFLIEIKNEKKQLVFGEPLNITDRPGYDNQPVFSQDDKEILYVSYEDTIQTEIFSYNIEKHTSTLTGTTPESEFSPVFINGTNEISIVRVDSDKAQRLYKYETTPGNAELLIDGVDSVGYYKWINDTTIALVVLNNGLELHVYELFSQQFIVAAKNVGRCLFIEPNSGKLIYTTTSNEETSLMTLDLETFESEFYFKGYKGAKDYVLTSSGELWTGWEGKLYSLNLSDKKEWIEIADFTKTVGPFYRLALSNNGKFLAVVSYKEKRP